MNTEEIFKQSGYTIPTDKHDECSKRFDYWDMIAFADLVIEKQQPTDSNLSQHLVSKLLTVGTKVEITKDINGHGFDIGAIVEIETVDPTDDGDVDIGDDLPYFVVSTIPMNLNCSWISSTECNVC